jgi:hypothetical protein
MRPRTFSKLAFLLCALSAARADGGQPSDLLYVWAWDKDEQESDFLAVIDVDEGSPTYGLLVNSIAVGVVGYAHHVEHQMRDPAQLFVNSFAAGRSFVFDMSAPRTPVIATSFDSVGPFAFPHSFERLDDGNVLATFQRSAERPGETGGLVELNLAGDLVRGSSAFNVIDPELRPYSLAPLPKIDRVVSTSADMMGEHRWRSGAPADRRNVRSVESRQGVSLAEPPVRLELRPRKLAARRYRARLCPWRCLSTDAPLRADGYSVSLGT